MAGRARGQRGGGGRHIGERWGRRRLTGGGGAGPGRAGRAGRAGGRRGRCHSGAARLGAGLGGVLVGGAPGLSSGPGPSSGPEGRRPVGLPRAWSRGRLASGSGPEWPRFLVRAFFVGGWDLILEGSLGVPEPGLPSGHPSAARPPLPSESICCDAPASDEGVNGHYGSGPRGLSGLGRALAVEPLFGQCAMAHFGKV